MFSTSARLPSAGIDAQPGGGISSPRRARTSSIVRSVHDDRGFTGGNPDRAYSSLRSLRMGRRMGRLLGRLAIRNGFG
jgi:hypothetical protein